MFTRNSKINQKFKKKRAHASGAKKTMKRIQKKNDRVLHARWEFSVLGANLPQILYIKTFALKLLHVYGRWRH